MPSSLRLWIGTVILAFASLLAAFFGVFNMVFSDIFGVGERIWSYVYVGVIYLVFGFLSGLIGPAHARRWVWLLSVPAVAILVLYTFSEFQNILIHAGFAVLVPLASIAGVRAGARLRAKKPDPKG